MCCVGKPDGFHRDCVSSAQYGDYYNTTGSSHADGVEQVVGNIEVSLREVHDLAASVRSGRGKYVCVSMKG